jgi:hypothetical protein
MSHERINKSRRLITRVRVDLADSHRTIKYSKGIVAETRFRMAETRLRLAPPPNREEPSDKS